MKARVGFADRGGDTGSSGGGQRQVAQPAAAPQANATRAPQPHPISAASSGYSPYSTANWPGPDVGTPGAHTPQSRVPHGDASAGFEFRGGGQQQPQQQPQPQKQQTQQPSPSSWLTSGAVATPSEITPTSFRSRTSGAAPSPYHSGGSTAATAASGPAPHASGAAAGASGGGAARDRHGRGATPVLRQVSLLFREADHLRHCA
jgi:hypothetical protein